QAYQQQLQLVSGQKEALNMQTAEISKALEELSGQGKGEVYKISGPVLIKVSSAEAVKDLKSKKELAALRLKTIEKSEAGLKEKLEDLREKLSKAGV
ncbi:MAG: prefoldin subunit beta, partial [Candidatus Aenigmatarchaeota archaeon]